MSRFARVTSIEVLQQTAGALQKFRSEATAVIDEVDALARRALEWIQHDRKDYWAHELRRGSDRVTEARLQWQQARVSRRVEGHEPACVDEQRAFEKAKRRLELVEDKVRAVGRWQRAVEQAVDEYRQSRVRFTNWLDTDLSLALAALQRMSASLDNYVALGTPEDSAPRAPAQDEADHDQPSKEASP